jgi:hypothetical protein
MTTSFDLFGIPIHLTRKIRAVWTILLMLGSTLVFSQKEINNSSPNFIVILVDDQGWSGTSVQMKKDDASSMSDYHHTPNLEKLAAKGMRFSQTPAFLRAQSRCSPCETCSLALTKIRSSRVIAQSKGIASVPSL